MKNHLILKSTVILVMLFITGCTKTESTFEEETPKVTSINISASQNNVLINEKVNFSVFSNLGTNLSTVSIFFVDNIEISGNEYSFQELGTYTIKAIYQNLTSNTIQVKVENPIITLDSFVNRVLVEEYSGTWCGNCPRILYGTELLKQQTDKEVSVQIHLFNNDPFISSAGNVLATSLGVSNVPTGRINRTINWDGPQYQNVAQVISEIKSSSPVGLAIESTVTSGNINLNVVLGFANNTIQTKLMVYVVEDNLFQTQANYSSNLYEGLSSISNFEYDGVLRSVVSNSGGDAITVSGKQAQKQYTISVPSNVSNVNNAKIVAFLIDSNTNTVLNVRQASLGQNQELEMLK